MGDKEHYKMNESVEVTWDITDGERRRLEATSVGGPSKMKLNRPESRQLKKNLFGLGANKDVTDETPAEPPQDDFDEMPLGIDTVDMDMGTVELVLEPDPMIDEDDVTLYRLGIFMHMSNPQGGQLEPLLDYSLCPQPCTTPPNELMTGTMTFEIEALPDPHPLTLGQYDVWVLNGEGDGIAGPVTWKLEEKE